MNAIRVIHPYKDQGVWVFDDPDAGLTKEPFVSGADLLLDKMVAGLPNAGAGVTLLFSGQAFPGASFEFHWRREEMGGHWYFSPQFSMEGWLCPALFKYFESAPEKIFVQIQYKRQVRRR